MVDSPAMSVDDVSSTMASSSTDTLQSTLRISEDPRLQTSSTFYPLRNVEERSRDRSFPPATQIQRQSNSFKLSTQLDIHNQTSPIPRSTTPNYEPVMRPSSRQDRVAGRGRSNSISDISRRATVEDYASSSSSSSSDTTEIQFMETDVLRSLSSIAEGTDRPGRSSRRAPTESRLIYSGREYPEATGYREDGFGPRQSETRSRARAMSTNSMIVPLKVEIPPRRSVRWKDELVLPSPLPRRTGWFNRRG